MNDYYNESVRFLEERILAKTKLSEELILYTEDEFWNLFSSFQLEQLICFESLSKNAIENIISCSSDYQNEYLFNIIEKAIIPNEMDKKDKSLREFYKIIKRANDKNTTIATNTADTVDNKNESDDDSSSIMKNNNLMKKRNRTNENYENSVSDDYSLGLDSYL